MKPKEPLPDYASPPVVEVAISVQFKAPSLSGPRQVLWWTLVRDRFPKLEEAPALPPVIETFERPRSPAPRITFQFSDTPPVPRILMVDESGAKLIQLQQDRFGYNWRRTKPTHAYPRYNTIKAELIEQLVAFEKFLASENLENMAPTQCELAYVNHILPVGVWQGHGELHKVIPSVTPCLSENFLPSPEGTNFHTWYVMANEEQRPVGRLHVTAEPQFQGASKEPIFLMKLVARGVLQGDGHEGLLKSLDMWHEWIVRGFTTLTSKAMHEAWRRKA